MMNKTSFSLIYCHGVLSLANACCTHCAVYGCLATKQNWTYITAIYSLDLSIVSMFCNHNVSRDGSSFVIR
jgi:hypothetical protein